MKEQLVEMTGLSPRVIRVWFQNKRCKHNKKTNQMKMQMEQEKVEEKHGKLLEKDFNSFIMSPTGNETNWLRSDARCSVDRHQSRKKRRVTYKFARLRGDFISTPMENDFGSRNARRLQKQWNASNAFASISRHCESGTTLIKIRFLSLFLVGLII